MDEFNKTFTRDGKQATVQLSHESLTSPEIDKARSVDENKCSKRQWTTAHNRNSSLPGT